jgi:uncharacterized protein YndB with AHSA1/START domain
MADHPEVFERTITVQATAADVFAFVRNPDNLPRYLPTEEQATRGGGEKIRIKGNAHGHLYESEGYFRVDENGRRMEWGAIGDRHYSRWLTVMSGDVDPPITEIKLHLEMIPRMVHEPALQGGPTAGEQVLLAMEKALILIQNHVEKVQVM